MMLTPEKGSDTRVNTGKKGRSEHIIRIQLSQAHRASPDSGCKFTFIFAEFLSKAMQQVLLALNTFLVCVSEE
jgi:hypothetical protein